MVDAFDAKPLDPSSLKSSPSFDWQAFFSLPTSTVKMPAYTHPQNYKYSAEYILKHSDTWLSIPDKQEGTLPSNVWYDPTIDEQPWIQRAVNTVLKSNDPDPFMQHDAGRRENFISMIIASSNMHDIDEVIGWLLDGFDTPETENLLFDLTRAIVQKNFQQTVKGG